MSLVFPCTSSRCSFSFTVIVWISSRMDNALLKAHLFSLYVQEKITNRHLPHTSKRPSRWNGRQSMHPPEGVPVRSPTSCSVVPICLRFLRKLSGCPCFSGQVTAPPVVPGGSTTSKSPETTPWSQGNLDNPWHHLVTNTDGQVKWNAP